MGTQGAAFVAAVLVGGGLAIVVVSLMMRVRTKQRTLAQILDDTMGTAQVPVEVVSESPEHGELSTLTVRISGIFGRIDTHGALERRLERAAIPLRAGEYLVISSAIAFGLAVVIGVMMGHPSARSSRSRLSRASRGTCRPGARPRGSRRFRSSCPTRWR